MRVCLKCAARGSLKYRTQKSRQKSPSGYHRTSLSGYIFATKARIDSRNLLSSNMSSTCSHNMVNFGLLTADIWWRVWATPVNFNGFRVLPSLLQRRHLPEANQTLRDVWPSRGLIHYIYTFGLSCLLTEFCHMQNSFSVHLRTIAQVSRAISSQLRHLSTIGKKLTKQQYVLQVASQYGELRPTSGWDRSGILGHPWKFQLVSRLGSVTARHVVVGVSQTLRRWTEGATYIRQGGHHVGHRPTF